MLTHLYVITKVNQFNTHKNTPNKHPDRNSVNQTGGAETRQEWKPEGLVETRQMKCKPDRISGNQTGGVETRQEEWKPDRRNGNQTGGVETRQEKWKPDRRSVHQTEV